MKNLCCIYECNCNIHKSCFTSINIQIKSKSFEVMSQEIKRYCGRSIDRLLGDLSRITKWRIQRHITKLKVLVISDDIPNFQQPKSLKTEDSKDLFLLFFSSQSMEANCFHVSHLKTLGDSSKIQQNPLPCNSSPAHMQLQSYKWVLNEG